VADVRKVVLHTDGGSEYTARAFRAACSRLGVAQSMGRPGSALDNAAIESFHSTLEFELRRLEHFYHHRSPPPGRRMDRRIQPGTPALRAGHAQPDRLRTGRAHRQTPTSRRPRSRRDHCPTVLTGVKAKPYGWPTVSLDPGCGRQQPAITETSQKNSHTTTIRLGHANLTGPQDAVIELSPVIAAWANPHGGLRSDADGM
jgi:hypothetical protein